MSLSSTAFEEDGTIPQKYTCDGENLSPPLAWSGAPQGTKSLALIMEDPDSPLRSFVHWVLYDMPAELVELPEDVGEFFTVEGIGIQGNNGFGKTGYGGPCPPSGGAHRYVFNIYALDVEPGLNAQSSKSDLEKAMEGHILAQGQLTGMYGR